MPAVGRQDPLLPPIESPQIAGSNESTSEGDASADMARRGGRADGGALGGAGNAELLAVALMLICSA